MSARCQDSKKFKPEKLDLCSQVGPPPSLPSIFVFTCAEECPKRLDKMWHRILRVLSESSTTRQRSFDRSAAPPCAAAALAASRSLAFKGAAPTAESSGSAKTLWDDRGKIPLLAGRLGLRIGAAGATASASAILLFQTPACMHAYIHTDVIIECVSEAREQLSWIHCNVLQLGGEDLCCGMDGRLACQQLFHGLECQRAIQNSGDPRRHELVRVDIVHACARSSNTQTY